MTGYMIYLSIEMTPISVHALLHRSRMGYTLSCCTYWSWWLETIGAL